MSEEIALAGLIIQKVSPDLNLMGDLSKKIDKRLFYLKQEKLKNEEGIFCSTHVDNAIPSLSRYLDLSRVTRLLNENSEMERDMTAKKRAGRLITYKTRLACKNREPFSRDLTRLEFQRDQKVRYQKNEQNQNKLFSKVEKLAWKFIINPTETGLAFFPNFKPKKGPSLLLKFLAAFREFIDQNEVTLSKMLDSPRNVKVLSDEAKYLLKKALKGYLRKKYLIKKYFKKKYLNKNYFKK
jgi:hypothetical protein